MRSDADTFTGLLAQNAQHSEGVRANVAGAARRRAKLLKRKELVEAREAHVRELQREYRTNAAQLAHDYAAAAVSKVQPDHHHGGNGSIGHSASSSAAHVGYDPMLALPLPSGFGAGAGAGSGAGGFSCPSPATWATTPCSRSRCRPASAPVQIGRAHV